MNDPRPDRSRGERGCALLVVIVMVAATVAVSGALIGRASLAASELRARRSVLCARYAALGGLAYGAQLAGEAGAALVGPGVDSLAVSRVRRSATWCVLRATASCRGATRTLDRTLRDATVCDSAAT